MQVGNAPAFDEQDVLNNAYTSPVMTAVMAAFGEPEILSNTYTSRLDEIRIVLEGILVQQMIVQATLVDYFVAGAEEAGWSTEEIHSRLRRIVNFTTIGEVHIVTLSADAVYTSLQPSLAGNSLAGLLCADDLGPLMEGTKQVVDHPTVPCVSDGTPLQVCHGRQRKIATFRAGGSCDRRQFTSVPLIQFHTISSWGPCRSGGTAVGPQVSNRAEQFDSEVA